MEPSISRELAEFAAGLDLADVPEQIVDKAKASLLHNAVAAAQGRATAAGERAVAAASEDVVLGGTRLLGGKHGRGHDRRTAAFTNAVLMNLTNQCDSYRLLLHPGPCVLPAALAVADTAGASGSELLAAVVAGYEVQCRVGRELIGTAHAHGFRSSPVFGVLGAAVAAGRLLRLGPDKLHTALALSATWASGTLEPALAGSGELKLHEPIAAQNGVTAALSAAVIDRGADTALEGPLGFLNAVTGSPEGRLTYRFDGEGGRADLAAVTAGLGRHWETAQVAYKPYALPGYGNALAVLLDRMLARRPVAPGDVAAVDVELNWFEALYPTPARPRTGRTLVHAIVEGVLAHGGPVEYLSAGSGSLAAPVAVTPSQTRPYYAPRITITTTDGTVIADELSGDELKTGLAGDAALLRAALRDSPALLDLVDRLVPVVRELDQAPSIEPFLGACAAGTPITVR
ncbi:MmgE/PrpD family protein [Saccharomonospora sp. NPDC046836]|uniref:MmgE/PrpD family protein n=1 Tax=Saccharomonospora sp. NPDC046836 TaxID=3156921 RepID=UPI003401345A